jgi:diadenosine tetraphosphate (Ap4A) HIT family hydrolase
MFQLDHRIELSTVVLGDWPLSRVLFKNERSYPWFLLVPRKEQVQELFELTHEARQVLMEEINGLSQFVKAYFKSDKLNIGMLGNRVSQLHIHVVGRSSKDPLWPQGIWQDAMVANPYDESELCTLLAPLKVAFQSLKYRKPINDEYSQKNCDLIIP